MARLDRLGAAKEIAQWGSVLGREFGYEMIEAVTPTDAVDVQAGLAQLVSAGLLYQRGRASQATYLFKHALIQDAAYASLPRSTRQQAHGQIAQLLEARFPEVVATQPELLAHHYTEAGLSELAIGHWQRAGQRASDRSAHQEAMRHLTTGLRLLRSLPETLTRHQQELSLQTALGAASLIVKGHAAPEVEAAYTRARSLCQQLGDIEDVFPVLFGLWRFYESRPDSALTRQLGEDLLALAERRDEAPLYVLAHYALGATCWHLGEFRLAHRHLQESIARYTPAQHRSPMFRAGQDPSIACHTFAACTLWLLGYPDQALARAHDVLRMATELAHPFSNACARLFVAMVCQFRRDVQDVYEHAEAAVTISSEQGFLLWLTMSTILRAWALTARGQSEAGLRQMCQGLTDYRASGAQLFVTYYLTLLAESYGALDQVDEGLANLKDGLETMEHTSRRWWQAEVYRRQGELLLHQATPDRLQAESCFHQALRIARQQHAKSLELRAATSLAKWWQSQDKRQEAYDLLAPIYSWFTEGFDTADLQEANSLLRDLE